MKKIFVLFLFCFVQIPHLKAHFEVVATLEFIHDNNTLYVKATLEKKHLTYALSKEGDCAPKDMMSVCAEKYLLDHIQMKLNGKEIALVKEGLQLQKGYVILTYRVENVQTVENIDIESDYMLAYNSHSITKYVVKLGEKIRYFSTKDKLRKITIKKES